MDELQTLIHEVIAEGMKICETFQVACIIEKLPPGWREFKGRLLQKRSELDVEEVVFKLRVEADKLLTAEATTGSQPSEQKVNLAEHQKKEAQVQPSK